MTGNGISLDDFRESLAQLASKVSREELSDDERVARAKAKFIEKIDRRMAVDMETCIHCGMCAEACHFYEATEDEEQPAEEGGKGKE